MTRTVSDYVCGRSLHCGVMTVEVPCASRKASRSRLLDTKTISRIDRPAFWPSQCCSKCRHVDSHRTNSHASAPRHCSLCTNFYCARILSRCVMPSPRKYCTMPYCIIPPIISDNVHAMMLQQRWQNDTCSANLAADRNAAQPQRWGVNT